MSRRDVWLTLTLAVAKGMPEPEGLEVYEGHHGISITVDTQAQGRAWAKHLGLEEREPRQHTNDRGPHWICTWHRTQYADGPNPFPGWGIQLAAYPASLDEAAEPSPLAEQVIAAIGAAR